LRADTTDNSVALVPSQPMHVDGTRRFGWWQVDLVTGRTVGTMDTGFRQAGSEYAQLKKAVEKDTLGAAIYLGVMKPNLLALLWSAVFVVMMLAMIIECVVTQSPEP
jgi:hypothetical protein